LPVLTTPISRIILDLLAERESRLLTLVVAVRRSIGPFEYIKGDLSQIVRASVQKLVANGQVTEGDGMYSLTRR
jgi:hypothetical protein